MPSTTLRSGQPSLHDSAEHHLMSSMQSSDTSEHKHQQKRDMSQRQSAAAPASPADHLAKEEEDAAALLRHMQLLHHPQQENGIMQAADDMDIDDHMDVSAAPREDSGSSEARAAYFSGDSDLTAEPITACSGDDNEADGAKSSNSGSSSTPVLSKVRKPVAIPIMDINHAPCLAEACSVNWSVESEHTRSGEHDKVTLSYLDLSRREAAAATGFLAGTSTTPASWGICSTLVDLSEDFKGRHGKGHEVTKHSQCTSPPRKCRNAAGSGGNVQDSWLELRLGLNIPVEEPNREVSQHAGECQRGYDVREDRKHMYSIVRKDSAVVNRSDLEQQPVTLQLLPQKTASDHEICMATAHANYASSIMPLEVQAALAESASNACPAASLCPQAAHFRPSSNLLHNGSAYVQDTSSARLMARPLFMGDHSLQVSGHLQNTWSVRPGAASPAPYQYNDQLMRRDSQGFVWQTHDSSRASDRNLPEGSDGDIQRRRVTMYNSAEELTGWPPAPGSAMTSGLQRGEPSNMSEVCQMQGEGGMFRLPLYTSAVPAQLQSGMTWQGLLRSMSAEPLLQTQSLIREASSMHPNSAVNTFINAGVNLSQPPVGILLRRHDSQYPHMCSPTLSTLSSHAAAAVYHSKRLRLASSRCRNSDLWFSLQEAKDFSDHEGQPKELLSEHPMQKLYLRIRDGKMQIAVVKSYLLTKLGRKGANPCNFDEVEITCRGQVLSPNLTMQHVRDSIWLNQDQTKLQAIGYQHRTRHECGSRSWVMALCYQMLHTHDITLNLLKL